MYFKIFWKKKKATQSVAFLLEQPKWTKTSLLRGNSEMFYSLPGEPSGIEPLSPTVATCTLLHPV